ncbi:MAG: bifunctional histidinol-phosphatase/imidazoleglycerol-phosphate dehydratase HisB [Steroidobacteraceae bacterium]
MTGERIVFLDRDGTLVEEPADEQVDSLDKISLLPGVIPALLDLRRAGFKFVMVSNQDGLGTASLPTQRFATVQEFIVNLFASQGVTFDAVFICPHFKEDDCACRKPKIGLVTDYIRQYPIDVMGSYMIGDRDTDLAFGATLGVHALRVRSNGSEEETWPSIARRVLAQGRHARLRRTTRETDVTVDLDLSVEGPIHVATGLGFFDHMLEQIAKHAGFALNLACRGDLRIDEHHTVEDCALALGAALRQALGDKRGIGRYGFLLAMDEAQAQIALDISGRPYFVWEGRFLRERVGDLPTELVAHFFRSFAEALGAALHVTVRGENTHHMVEAAFKGVGRSLRRAIRLDGCDLPTTKGLL